MEVKIKSVASTKKTQRNLYYSYSQVNKLHNTHMHMDDIETGTIIARYISLYYSY